MPIVTSIPQRYKEGFRKIASSEDDFFEAIKDGLSHASLVPAINILARKITNLKKIELSDVVEVLISAGSLMPLLETVEKVEELITDVCLLASTDKENPIEEKDIPRLNERLLFLLNNKQLYYASKANALMTDYGNVLLNSKIVTDIRPVFGKDIEQPPEAVIVIHNLHFHYQSDEEGTHKDFYIALDSNDIKSLKETILRAEKKEKSLEPIYEKSGIQNLTK